MMIRAKEKNKAGKDVVGKVENTERSVKEVFTEKLSKDLREERTKLCR